MKKNLITSLMCVFIATNMLAMSNLKLIPNGGNVCNPMTISFELNGNGFTPVSYLWSTGEVTPSIVISTSGNYTLTITGYNGNNPANVATRTESATFNVLDAPQITQLTDLWVCKGDTVRLAATSGYDYINWSNGSTGTQFSRAMNFVGTPGSPALDTMSISYNAVIDKVCTVSSQTIVLRGIRKPHGVGSFYQNKMNIQSSDSIPAGLVLEYIYPVTYEMEFTDMSNPSIVIKYVTAPGSRKAPASMLSPGSVYSVRTTPVINGQQFCSGLPSTIGIASPAVNAPVSRFIAPVEDEGISTYKIYTVAGQLIAEYVSEKFNNKWLETLSPQLLIIHRTGVTTEITKMQLMR